jgi:hypothetical protein
MVLALSIVVVTAAPAAAKAHNNLGACRLLLASYSTRDKTLATTEAGDALDWFLYESRTRSVRAIMGKRGDDTNIRRDWGPAMRAWCKAHYTKKQINGS